MKNQTIETIIIGAGIAGLGCARQLSQNQRNFLVISEDIGGRIMTSADGRANYGAYFVLKNYHHILPLVKKGKKLHPFFVEFHDKKKHYYHLAKISRHPVQVMRLLFLLHKFKKRYEHFKKMCETKSQKSLIEKDAQFKKLYSQPATDFIKEKKIAAIANKFLSEGVYLCTFLPLSQVSAFDFMRLCLCLITPAYEFTFLQDKTTEHFKDKIVLDSVTKIKKDKEYEVYTKSGKLYKARNLVVAVPPTIAQQLLKIKKIKEGSNASVFHVAGILKESWKGGQFELFDSRSPVIFIRKQSDGSFIFYSKVANPHLEDYFLHPKIIFKKQWQPAFNISGNTLLDCEQGEHLYLIGDYNIIGLEDSYITGVCAANKIFSSL